MFLVLDMESGLAESLANRVLTMDQQFIFRKWDAQVDVAAEITAYQEVLKGIIISGSAKNVNSKKYVPPFVPPELFQVGVPILGICYGMQLIAKLLGQEIVRCWGDPEKKCKKKDKGEQGVVTTYLTDAGLVGAGADLFRGVGDTFEIWMKHAWMVQDIPEGWAITARTARCPVAGLSRGNVHLVQFHPEPYYSLAGKMIMHNFFTRVCGVETPYF